MKHAYYDHRCVCVEYTEHKHQLLQSKGLWNNALLVPFYNLYFDFSMYLY